jgi:hypothetical protein
LNIAHVFVANAIKFAGGDSGLNMGRHMIQYLAGQTASLSHPLDVFFCCKYAIHALIINDLEGFGLPRLPKN